MSRGRHASQATVVSLTSCVTGTSEASAAAGSRDTETLSRAVFSRRALSLNLPIVNVKRERGGGGALGVRVWGGVTSCGRRLFEVPVLKEPLIAIRISLNKRLRNIGWFLAFASRSCLLTSEV